MNLGDYIEVYGDIDNTLKADGFDDCIVGVDTKSRLIYNADKIVDNLAKDMTREEALEFFYYNIDGASMGEYTPVFMFGMGELDIKKENVCTCDVYGYMNCNVCNEIETKKECPHENIEYQPEEKDTNAAEYMYCEDCGEELPLPDNPEIN